MSCSYILNIFCSKTNDLIIEYLKRFIFMRCVNWFPSSMTEVYIISLSPSQFMKAIVLGNLVANVKRQFVQIALGDLILTITVMNSAPTWPLNLVGQKQKGVQVFFLGLAMFFLRKRTLLNHDNHKQCRKVMQIW